jgi:hypothetical protein
MPQLAAIIGAKWAFATEAAEESQPAEEAEELGVGGVTRGGNLAQRADGVKVEKEVVQWREADQRRWYDLVTNFQAISRLPRNRPTLPMALYIQQDLWLLDALFTVIKQVNGDADAMDNADIKRIDHIFFGRDALGMAGTVSLPNARLRRQAIDQGKGREVPAATGVAATAPPAPAITIMPNSRDFLHGRYVNSRFEPLAADTVRDAIASEQLSNNAELIVAKRIPFRVGFVMDERRIPEFLAACANSPFRFEVRQVRINRHVPGQTASLDGKTVGGESDAFAQGESVAAQVRGGGTNQPVKTVATRTNYDVNVEFYGIIKLYNPVNNKLLETPGGPAASQTAAN